MRKKRIYTKKKHFSWVQVILLLILGALVYLKLSGVNNLREFKKWMTQIDLFVELFGLSKEDPLKLAEKNGRLIIQKFNEKEKLKSELLELAQKFANDYSELNWNKVYEILSFQLKESEDGIDFNERMNLNFPKWLDEEVNIKVLEIIKKNTSLSVNSVNLISLKKAEVSFEFKYIDLEESLPKIEDIENYDKLDAVEVEVRTGILFLEKLESGKISRKREEVKLRFLREKSNWTVELDNILEKSKLKLK